MKDEEGEDVWVDLPTLKERQRQQIEDKFFSEDNNPKVSILGTLIKVTIWFVIGYYVAGLIMSDV